MRVAWGPTQNQTELKKTALKNRSFHCLENAATDLSDFSFLLIYYYISSQDIKNINWL